MAAVSMGTRDEMAEIANELQSQVDTLNSDLEKSHKKITALENEIIKIRKASELAVEETNLVSRMVKNKEAEIKSLNTKIQYLTSDLIESRQAEVYALNLKKTYEDKELGFLEQQKVLEKENNLLTLQVSNLTGEVNALKHELQTNPFSQRNIVTDLKRDLCDLKKKFAESTNNESQLKAQIKSLSEELEQSRTTNKNELVMMNKTLENYKLEIEESNKIAEFNKAQYENSLLKMKELSEQMVQLGTQYQESIKEYHKLESRYNDSGNGVRDNEIITKLKKELDTANGLLLETKEENLSLMANVLTPSAAALSKILKCDMSITQIYTQLLKITSELKQEKENNRQLNSKINNIVKDLDNKISKIRTTEEEKEKIKQEYTKIQEKLNDLIIERNKLKDEIEQITIELIRNKKDIERLNTELSDKERQVCYLLQQAEQVTAVKMEDNTSETGNVNTESKVEVTFRNIEELMKNNQQLMQKVRELSEKQQEISDEQTSSSELKTTVEILERTISHYRDMVTYQKSMLVTSTEQRNLYKKLYDDYMNGKRQDNCESSVTRTVEAMIVTTSQDDSSDTELVKTKKQLEDLKKAYDIYKQEKETNYNMVCEENFRMKKEVELLTMKNSNSESNSEFYKQQAIMLQGNFDNSRKLVAALQLINDRNKKIECQYEETFELLRKETFDAVDKLAKAEVYLDKYKMECEYLKVNETRLQAELELLTREKISNNTLKKNLEMIKMCQNRIEAEKIGKLETKIKELLREIEYQKQKNDEYITEINALKFDLETEKDTSLKRKQQDDDYANNMRAEITQLRLDLEDRNRKNEDLTKKMKIALTSNNSANEFIKKNKELEDQVCERNKEIKLKCKEIEKGTELIKKLNERYETLESKYKQQCDEHNNYKTQSEDMLRQCNVKINQLQSDCAKLEEDISILRNKPGASSNADKNRKDLMINRSENEREVEGVRSEINDLQEKLIAAEEKYSKVMLLHSRDKQTLTEMRGQLAIIQNQFQETIAIKDEQIKNMASDLSQIKEVEFGLRSQNQELLLRFNDVNNQNNLLHDQIEHLTTLIPPQSDSMNESGNKSSSLINISINEDEITSPEKLLKIIKSVRKEKEIIKGKCDVYESMTTRLKEQVICLEKHLVETKETMNKLRESSDKKISPTNENPELLKKIELLDAITDSNRLLRNERDVLSNRVKELLDSINTLETEIEPLKNTISELTANSTSLESENNNLKSENTTLKADLARLKNRVNALADRSINTSSEDWKRLQNERQKLVEMLTTKKETIGKLTQELESLKSKYEDILNENNILKEEAQNYKNNRVKDMEELTKLKAENKSISDVAERYRKVIDDDKTDQVKNIARKYINNYKEIAILIEERTKYFNPEHQIEVSKEVNFEKIRENFLKNMKNEDQIREELKVAQDEIVKLTDEIKLIKEEMEAHEKQFKEDIKNAVEKSKDMEKLLAKEKLLQQSGETSTSDPPTADIKPIVGSGNQIRTSESESTGTSSVKEARGVKRSRSGAGADTMKMRIQGVLRSEDVEYQVPTSSRSDQEECAQTGDSDEGPCTNTSYATRDPDDDDEDNEPLAGHSRKAKPESSAAPSASTPRVVLHSTEASSTGTSQSETSSSTPNEGKGRQARGGRRRTSRRSKH